MESTTEPLPLQFQSFRDIEASLWQILPINGIAPWDVTRQALWERTLLDFLGVPKLCQEFTKNLMGRYNANRHLTIREVTQARCEVFNAYRIWPLNIRITPREKLILVAWSLSGLKIEPDHRPLAPRIESTWQELHDACCCLVTSSSVALVPYHLFVGGSEYQEQVGDPSCLVCLKNTIRQFIKQVDEEVVAERPWNSWETFGAFHYALRINSLLTIGKTIVPFSAVINGAVIHSGCDQEVVLRPMEVDSSDIEYSSDMTHEVLEEPKIWKNKLGGSGVDIFFALQTLTKDTLLVCADQRKRPWNADGSGRSQLKDFFALSDIAPTSSKYEFILVRGLVNVLSTFSEQDHADIPHDGFVVTSLQAQEFHTCLLPHPAASPLININSSRRSHLQLVLNPYKPECGEAVRNRAKITPFKNEEELREFIDQQFPQMENQGKNKIRWEQMEFICRQVLSPPS